MPHYKNKSKFYKRLNIDGKRINVPPNGNFFSSSQLDLSIYDYLELTQESVTVQPSVPQKTEKVIQLEPEKIQNIEKAILALNEKINKNISLDNIKSIVTNILNETPKIEQEEIERMAQELKTLKTSLQQIPATEIVERLAKFETILQNDVLRRQEILKRAIDEVNTAVVQMEDYIYNEREDNKIPIVVEDEEEPPKSTGPSLEDIIRGM